MQFSINKILLEKERGLEKIGILISLYNGCAHNKELLKCTLSLILISNLYI